MKKNNGFTLVEVFVLCRAFSHTWRSIFEFFIMSHDTASSNEGKLDAVMIAQKVLEDVKNGKYPEITSDCKNTAYPKVFQNHSSAGNRACDMSLVEDKAECQTRYEKRIKNDRFYVEIEAGRELDPRLGLHPVEVKVYDQAGKLRSSVKGAVKICADAS